jgi:vitamin B12 transporter
LAASLTAFQQRLQDEIVDTFDFQTLLSSTANSTGTSRRWGIEAEFAWRPVAALRLSANYGYLRATQPDNTDGDQVKELRRPKHSGAITVDGAFGPWRYGASLAYVGARHDFLEVAPFGIVRVDPYWLAGARVAYEIAPGMQVHVRGSNLFDARYEESAGYRTEGRGLFVGIRLADPRSSP